MAEEKKEEIKAEAQASPAPDAQAPATEAAKVASPAPAQAPENKKKETPANCADCNKSIKQKRWYYRDGKYYCTKRCWSNKIKKESKAAAEAPKEGEK
jgi:formylmethanofuran dehydrogenase subunit E